MPAWRFRWGQGSRPVEPGVRSDHIEPRPQPEMEGVAEHDLGTDFAQFVRTHRLDRPVGTDRHERRRVDDTVGEHDSAAACRAVSSKDLKPH